MTSRFPLKVTPFFQRKVEEEFRVLGHRRGPLSRIVLPVGDVDDAQDLLPDFVGDRTNERRIGRARVIRKYRDRLLFLPTTSCLAHCRFCFRQDYMLDEPVRRAAIEGALVDLACFLRENTEVREVILSGGDPLAIPPGDLARIIEFLLASTDVDVRVHTKALSFHPDLLLRPEVKASLVRDRVRTIFHVLHPYELCERTLAVLDELRQAGARFYNQFPIIAGINDHSAVLLELFRVAEKHRLRTVNVFAPEPIPGSDDYRVPLRRFYQLMDEVNVLAPPWLASARWVLDSPTRKWQRDNIVEWTANRVLFSANGEQFEYEEPALGDYVAPDPSVLLWRSARFAGAAIGL